MRASLEESRVATTAVDVAGPVPSHTGAVAAGDSMDLGDEEAMLQRALELSMSGFTAPTAAVEAPSAGAVVPPTVASSTAATSTTVATADTQPAATTSDGAGGGASGGGYAFPPFASP